MLSQSSLVKRLTLMIMFAVISVLVVAGISVNMLSQHHFRMLDEQALSEKLESTRHILSIQTPGTRPEELREQLRALLGAHQDLTAEILTSDGCVLFSDLKTSLIPDRYKVAGKDNMWEWQDSSHNFRGVTSRVQIQGDPALGTVMLMLDVTSHAHFFETLQRWFSIVSAP